ncbi:hypothetical protein TYRP_016388 [Tyrophagus putrescentiae]|nr:hypothetical protein TYRP_016388 [Tyrophagus putrescentiae]
MAPNCTSNWYPSEVQLQLQSKLAAPVPAPPPSLPLFANISRQLVSSTMSTMTLPTMTSSSQQQQQCASKSAFLSCRSQSSQPSSHGASSRHLYRRPSSPSLSTSTNTTTTSPTATFCSRSSSSLMSSTLITITRHHLCQILERLSGDGNGGSVRTTATTATSTKSTKKSSGGGVSMAATATSVGLTPTHSPTPASALPSPSSLSSPPPTSRLTEQASSAAAASVTSEQRLPTTIQQSLAASTSATTTSNASSSSSSSVRATFIKSILQRDTVNEPVNYDEASRMMTEAELSCCSCQSQLLSTDYRDSAQCCRLSSGTEEDVPLEPVPAANCAQKQSANMITVANSITASPSTATRHSRRHHHHRRPTPWSSSAKQSSSWWSRLLCSGTSMTSSATSSLFVTLLLVLFSTMLHTADSCSSRSTPKPRPPTPTTRPNITFQTYACPEAYAKWYCLNGATCFSVRIGESILYNCECSDGYMGQRCEFKDLDGSYLPSREKILVETAGIAGGVTLAVILVVVFTIYYFTYVRKHRLAQEHCSAPLLEDDSCSSAAASSYRDHLGGHDNGAFNGDYNNGAGYHHHHHHHQRNSNLMQHYQHQSASKTPGIVTDQLTLLCSSAGKQQQYGSIQNRTSPALLAPSPSPSSQCIVCLNTNLHHQVPTTATTSSSHLRDLESGQTNAFFSC